MMMNEGKDFAHEERMEEGVGTSYNGRALKHEWGRWEETARDEEGGGGKAKTEG